jgi:hypothetical protein
VAIDARPGPSPQNRSFGAVADGALDGSADHRCHRDEDDFVALAVDSQDAVAVFLAQSSMLAPVASKIRRPNSPSRATSA